MKVCILTINSLPVFLAFLILSLFSCGDGSGAGTKTGINNPANQSEAFKGDSLIKIEISESVNKFKINDSMAIALVRQVPEIRQIIDYKYKDTTMYNQLHIENVPADSDKNWHFQIVQFQPRTEHAANLLWLLVDANSGRILIWDIPGDSLMSIDTWKRKITGSQK